MVDRIILTDMYQTLPQYKIRHSCYNVHSKCVFVIILWPWACKTYHPHASTRSVEAVTSPRCKTSTTRTFSAPDVFVCSVSAEEEEMPLPVQVFNFQVN